MSVLSSTASPSGARPGKDALDEPQASTSVSAVRLSSPESVRTATCPLPVHTPRPSYRVIPAAVSDLARLWLDPLRKRPIRF